ncbi:MAG: CBS domain-containing protein [Methanomicrobiales archaeon]|nr:CBS domain-containing protein [Methanomicrobiales archaeon]
MDEWELSERPLTLLMRQDLNTVPPDMPLVMVFTRFLSAGCEDLVVIDAEGRFLGVITALDLIATVGPTAGVRSRRRGTCIECLVQQGKITARDVMGRHHITISAEGTVGEAIRLMERNRYGDLFILDDDGRVTGRISACDIIGHFCRGCDLV